MIVKKESSIFPLLLFKPRAIIQPMSSDIAFNSYSLGQKNFGKLANREVFREQCSSCIEVDIVDECNVMNEENFLEITVPVLTLNDLKGTVKFLHQFIRHPILLTVNGYGAKTSEKNNFPHVDFINVLDIANNRYEIIVSPTGNLELPKEGFGLYTIIKEITYVLSYRQAIKGDGLEDLTFLGAKKKSVTFHPPMSTEENFKFYICITHFDTRNRRIVDSIRPVEINFSPPSIKSDFPVLSPRMLYIKTNETSFLENEKKISGWSRHPVSKDIWMRRFGLQLSTRERLLKLLYNEHEFMRDFLLKKILEFSSFDGYNDFLLRPETFSKIYESFIHDVVHGYISKEIFIDLLDENVLERINFSNLSSDFHDTVVLSELEKEFIAKEKSFEYFMEVFFGEPNLILPTSSIQMAMVPITKEEQEIISAVPLEWVFLSERLNRLNQEFR